MKLLQFNYQVRVRCGYETKLLHRPINIKVITCSSQELVTELVGNMQFEYRKCWLELQKNFLEMELSE